MTHLRKADYEVRDVELVRVRELIAEHHYAGGSSNTAVFAHGLIRLCDSELVGVAQWLPPTKNAAVATYPEGDWRKVVALSRLAIIPEVPTNAASFLIGASIRLIRATRKWGCLVTYADTRLGHTGAIYRATNWEYLGETAKYRNWLDADGKLVSRQATKSRTHAEMFEKGYELIWSSKHKFRMLLPTPRNEKRPKAEADGRVFVEEPTRG